MKNASRLMLRLILLFSLVLASQTLFSEESKNFDFENKYYSGEEVVISFVNYEKNNVESLIPPENYMQKDIIIFKEKDFYFRAVSGESNINDKIIRNTNYKSKGKPTIRVPTIKARRKTC